MEPLSVQELVKAVSEKNQEVGELRDAMRDATAADYPAAYEAFHAALDELDTLEQRLQDARRRENGVKL